MYDYCNALKTVQAYLMLSFMLLILIAGETANFEVSLNCEPSSLVWLKNNRPISGDVTSRMQSSKSEDGCVFKLVISTVKKEDAGLYIAAAQSNTGQISCSAQLLVHER